jgi:hypothetical protein
MLGTTAANAFDLDREESLSQHHFLATDGRISLDDFLKQTHFALKPSSNSYWSFSCEYYSHLWLDVFVEIMQTACPSGDLLVWKMQNLGSL